VATVLVYSSDASVRERVRIAVGRTPAADLSPLTFVEAADGPAASVALGAGGIDLGIFDGEAWPTGGLGLCRELKNELRDCPPVIVVTARPDDHWLAAWSMADAELSHPLDPVALTECVVRLLRERAQKLPEPAPTRGALGLFRRG
jgi:DNA-binding response OmpR family regulator